MGRLSTYVRRARVNKKKKADPITDEEEEQMWAAKVLGSESSHSLNFTVWYLLSQQLGT